MLDLNYIKDKVDRNIKRLENDINSKLYDKRYLKNEYYYIMGQNNILGDILIDLREDEKIYTSNRDKLDYLYNLID